jgi:hypothetical protein
MTGRLTVCRNVTLVLTFQPVGEYKFPSSVTCEEVASQRGQETLNTEAEESTLLGAVTWKRYGKLRDISVCSDELKKYVE